MEGFIAVCATAKRWEALVPNKRANNGLAGDTYANEGVPRESILGCAHNNELLIPLPLVPCNPLLHLLILLSLLLPLLTISVYQLRSLEQG